MWDNVVLEIYNLRWLISAYVLAVVLMCAFFWLQTARFRWTRSKIRYFGMLYRVSTRTRLAVTLALGRYMFILVSVVLCTYTGIYHVAVLLVFSLAINVIEVDIKKIFGDLVVYAAIFAIMLFESILYQYYFQVEKSAAVIIMVVFLGIFAALYSTYSFITSYDRILKNEMKSRDIAIVE